MAIFYFFLAIPFLSPFACAAQPESVYLKVFPEKVIQGEPLMATVEGAAGLSSVKKISFERSALGLFLYKGKPTALIGIDLNKKPAEYEITAEVDDGRIIRKTVIVEERKKISAPLGIPKKLGGDTPAGQNLLAATLALENRSIANMRTGKKSFWTEKFRYPLAETAVTDPYGYSRKTGQYSIAHKGVDFKAEEGTLVTAANRGVVRAARTYRNYGRTVIVDHGLGLMTFYMHLSEIRVNEGELVKPGQLVGLSGQTGYALSPHLHFTVRVGGVSVDPIKFFELFE